MLISPGTEISIVDESQYLPSAVGSVPFLLIATAQNKVFNGAIAPYSTKVNAGKLLAITSQRELITNFGYPQFQQSAAGTPLHGHELNEYGLMAAYSALGTSNRMYIIRADVDLNELEGTSVRPISAPADGTYWLDLTNTQWGIYEWNAITQEFVNRLPLVLTSPNSTTPAPGTLIPTPISSIGRIGSYAVVASSPNNYIFYKRADNVWVQVGSPEWQLAWPTIVGTKTSAEVTLTPMSQLVINTVTVTLSGTSLAVSAAEINAANITGVTAALVNDKLALYVSSSAKSDGSTADGQVRIIDGVGLPAAVVGLPTTGTAIASLSLQYGTYLQVPDWRDFDSTPRPSGSVWVKTSAIGKGIEIALRQYDAANAVWNSIATPVFPNEIEALYSLDPNAGGFGIDYGSVFIAQDVLNNGTVSFRPYIRSTQGETIVVGTTPLVPMLFTVGDKFRVQSSSFTKADLDPATPALIDVTITLTGTTADDFISAFLAAGIPDISIEQDDDTKAITLIHREGGTIILNNVVGTPLDTAGFTLATSGMYRVPNTNPIQIKASNFTPLIYTYSLTQPYTSPADGTLWYYNNPLDVDIMVNDVTGWKGYRNVVRDARGYNLINTDPNGPIFAPLAPLTNSSNDPLAKGDLWINTGDLENFPVISRWNGARWVLIDNTDVISQNGIVFADARWDIDGTTDPANAPMVAISKMLTSNYVDLDCPDHRLYPRGTLLFNLRRSGFNVKHYVNNYFNVYSYPNADLTNKHPGAWVTSSGLMANGSPYMGHKAQRNMVIKAMRSALDSSDTVREEIFGFNLIAAPGYPELISNMIQMNNDRKNTAFILGDTPMTLPASITDITSWATGNSDDSMKTSDAYTALYYPSGLSNDLQGNLIVVPPSHMILRTAIRSDQVSYPWFPFAGTRRGLVDNAIDVGYVNSKTGAFVRHGIHQGMRDALYQLNINPIALLPNVGITNFGNKTRQGTASAKDRVNVARLINYIRTILAHAGDSFLFEPNDQITRSQFKHVIESAIGDLVAKRGIYDYLVVCDESNNTPDRIARNEMYCDIVIEPMRAVEFIYIPIRLRNPGGIKSA
jgi:hypothetical protein